MSILKVRVFEPVVTGDNFTRRGPEEAAETAKQLRTYWKAYGRMPFDERMMKTLTDPKAGFEAVREAAYNLANLGEKRTLSTMVFSDRDEDSATRPNPAVAKFTKPTVAEAILAAMDRDLAHHAAGQHDQLYDYRRRQIEDSYLDPLVNWATGASRPSLSAATRQQPRSAFGVNLRRPATPSAIRSR